MYTVGNSFCRYRANKMVCDCEYAEKNNGMDEDTQACVAEKLTLDHSLSLVNEAEMLATKDTSMIWQRLSGTKTNKFNYENCRCFWITHIQDLCGLCVRGCRCQAMDAFYDREAEEQEEKMRKVREEDEKRRKIREKAFRERLAKESEERRKDAAKWFGREMDHSTT